MCDVTLLASRCHASSKPRSTPHAVERKGGRGLCGEYHKLAKYLWFVTRKQGSGQARDLTDGIYHPAKVSGIPHGERAMLCGLYSSVTVRPWWLVWC